MTVREWLLDNWQSFDNRPECINAGHKALRKSVRTVRKVVKQLEDSNLVNWGREKGDIQEKKDFQISPDNKLAHLSLVSKVPHTVKDLMDIAELPPEKWEIARQRANFWGNAVNPNWQIRAEFVRKVSEGCEEFLNQVKESMKEFIPKYPKLTYIENDDINYLLDISLSDAHIGLIAKDYNVKIAIERYLDSAAKIINWYKNYPINQIVFTVGNDIFNANDSQGQTAKGNKRDESPLWRDTFKLVFEAVVHNIDLCQTIAPVHIKIVGGNHDYDRAFHLGFALEMWYRDCPQVTIDNSDSNYKFYRWNKILLGYNHGDSRPMKELPMIMATQSNPQDWAETVFRIWNTGHDHHGKEHHFLSRPITTGDDIHGIIIKTAPGLCGHSTWESWKGYKSLKSAIGTLYHPTEGEISNYKFNI